MEEYEPMLDDECRGCGKSLRRLMVLAMMEDGGCEMSPASTYCHGSISHQHFPQDDDLPMICGECLEPRPDDDRVKADMKCRFCAYGG